MRHSTYADHDYGFGLNILALRNKSNLTQSELGKRLGVSRQAIVGWETGISYPSPKHLLHLIELGLQYHAFHPGQETEEIRALWQSANPRVPLDETWLAQLLEKQSEASISVAPQPPAPGTELPTPGPQVDWGDAPEVASFYGRETELARLTDWLLEERCRVVSLLGMGGIGKTSLAARLVQQVAPNFERVYWRGLRDAPLPGEWLSGAIGFLSDQQIVPPAAVAGRLTTLLQLLRTRRCLLVLDNFDTLFEPGQAEGGYRTGLTGYSRLLQALGEAQHQSCLVLTTREAPPELAVLSSAAVRTFSLRGLTIEAAQGMLTPKQLVGSPTQWAELTTRFAGNSLALKLVGERIRELFDGEIGIYLKEASSTSVFGGVRQLLAEQVGRGSAAEQQVLQVLALAYEPVRLADLLELLGARLDRQDVLEGVEALLRRSLVERTETVRGATFSLQSVVLEYVTNRLVEEVAEEIAGGQPVLLAEKALVRAQARDYVRQSQERLIGVPILERLKARLGRNGAEQQLLALLAGWRGRSVAEQGYGPGNVVNLLRLLRGNLRGLDLSSLALRQAYLAEVQAQDTSLAGSQLIETVVAEAFGFPGAVALSGDGKLLATGTSTGDIWLWRVADRTLLAILQGHAGQVFGVALSVDGRLLASGGADGMVRLWDVNTEQLLATLKSHSASISGVTFSTDGSLLASGSMDGTICLWQVPSGQELATLEGHVGGVWSLAFSADGHLLASGGGDGAVRLWDVNTGRVLTTLQGHASAVWGVALSTESNLLISGGLDDTIQFWDISTGKSLATLFNQSGGVWNLALSADGRLLASSGEDGIVRLWETSSRRPLAILQGHIGGVRGVALSGNGHLVASGGLEGTVRLWDAPSGQPLATLQGHTGSIRRVALSADGNLVASSGERGVHLWDTTNGQLLVDIQSHMAEIRVVALSADGRLLASAGLDGMVRLWEARNGQLLAILEGHAADIWGVALSADGKLLASGDVEGIVRLWEVPSGRPLAILEGHAGSVRAVALSADGRLVASAGVDRTVRLWEAPSGEPLAILEGHTNPVFGVALSADGKLLASGDIEGTIRLWETPNGRPLAILDSHGGSIWTLALSADGQLVANGSADGTPQLWEVPSGRPLAILRGHTGPVPAVSIAADGHLVASGGWDGTVRLWEAPSGVLIRTLQPERQYARLDITGLTGITGAQRVALLALGAVENEA